MDLREKIPNKDLILASKIFFHLRVRVRVRVMVMVRVMVRVRARVRFSSSFKGLLPKPHPHILLASSLLEFRNPEFQRSEPSR